MTWNRLLIALIAAALQPLAGAAQGAGLAETCPAAGDARERCVAVAQAVESAHPQLGMLIAGGNPILGEAGAGGLRLGIGPRIDISPRLNLVFVRLPDILAAELGATAERANRELGIPVPALATTVAVGLSPGWTAAPGVGGIGSLDALVGASWLPFGLVDTDGFSRRSPFAWTVGGRLGLLRESFVVPAVSVSLLYRGLGQTSFGQVCRGEALAGDVCLGPGDIGEFSFDLRDVSARFAVSKRLLGLGAAAGIGYDRFTGDADYAFRVPILDGAGAAQVHRAGPASLSDDRWSGFGSLSYNLLLGSLVIEGGWMQGGTPIPEYGIRDFDPRTGSWFGSVGGRIGF